MQLDGIPLVVLSEARDLKVIIPNQACLLRAIGPDIWKVVIVNDSAYMEYL
jgi:hypothetical protein